MAKKKDAKPKNVLERTYNVPLRREFLKVAKWRRTEKAVTALKQFIQKHMKSNDVSIGRYANQELWKNGIKNPPHHIKVNGVKDEKGKVMVELAELSGHAKRQIEKEKGLKEKKEKKETKKKEEEAKKTEEEKKKKEAEKKDQTTNDQDKKEPEPKDQAKEIEKEKIKELKKELPKQQVPKPMAAPKQQVDQRATAPKSQ